MATDDLGHAIAQSHAALQSIINGDPGGYKALYSQSDEVTLGNPFAPFAKGRARVEATLEGTARNYRDGRVEGIDILAVQDSDDLACVVEIERAKAKIGGGPEIAHFALRVTSVFRREKDAWKLVHRHADPISAARSPATAISE